MCISLEGDTFYFTACVHFTVFLLVFGYIIIIILVKMIHYFWYIGLLHIPFLQLFMICAYVPYILIDHVFYAMCLYY